MSEDLERVSVHGRVFQRISLDERIYFAPIAIDDREESRLAAQHRLVSRIFGNGLFSPSIPVGEPHAILECGYGNGEWAVQCAEDFGDCEVTAVDIFPMDLPDQPENLDLICHNLNDPLRDPDIFQSNHYDIVHSRFLFPGIKTERWARYIRDVKLLLKPAGWVQMMEYLPIIQSHNGRLTEQSAVRRWWQLYQSAMASMNRDPRIGRRLKQLLLDNRYRDVDVDVVQLHIGDWSTGKVILFSPMSGLLVVTRYFSFMGNVYRSPWPGMFRHSQTHALLHNSTEKPHIDPTQASLGKDSVAMIGDLLESLGLWPLTSTLGCTAAEFDSLMQEVRTELQNVDLKLYIEIYVARGRKSTQ